MLSVELVLGIGFRIYGFELRLSIEPFGSALKIQM